MTAKQNFRFTSVSFLPLVLIGAGLLLLIPFSLSCSAFSTADEDIALKTLRQITSEGRLPAESLVLNIENRFSGTRTGALAKLLRARIRFENKDFRGAAELLDSGVFGERTTVADYAVWLRGRALLEAGQTDAGLEALADLVRGYPDSLRTRAAQILWAQTALESGRAKEVPAFLGRLVEDNDPEALYLTGRALEQTGRAAAAADFYRRAHIYGAGSDTARQAETKLSGMGRSTEPQTEQESLARADRLFAAKKYADAATAFEQLVGRYPSASVPPINFRRLTALARAGRLSEAQTVFEQIPSTAVEKEESFYELARGYGKAGQWAAAQKTAGEMRRQFPRSKFAPKMLVELGRIAGERRNRAEESYFLKSAVALYPNAVEVADAQFELAWDEHERGNFTRSAEMLIDHLARYVHKDTSNRGKAGYWAARDSERIGNTDAACALYEAETYRYGSNWYGYLADQRLRNLRARGQCRTTVSFPAGSPVPRAVENLKTVTVAPETATRRELARAEKAGELSIVGLFDWAIDELTEAKKTAENSPKINLALAKHHQLKGSNVRALIALKASYPDYSQMFPEEMGREEWAVFYPLSNWKEIKYWAAKRQLDPYHVAGFIRQETIFEPNAKSSANAYGLMQLLVPTARSMARKYGVDTGGPIYGSTLYDPALNIELGTAYMREQFDKYGRVEYVAAAYNAGPGRLVRWRKTLPLEIDEFVEEIPFRETRGYVQGIIRNSAQYRRLYDLDGNFKPNVGQRPLRGQIDALPPEQVARELPEVRLAGDSRAGEE